MLPRQIQGWILTVIWLITLIPPLVIKLWEWDPVFVFRGSAMVGEIVSDVFLAFFTAFPFWWLIESFTRMKMRFDVAKVQREFLDRSARHFNDFVHQQGTDWLIADRDKDPPNYLALMTAKEISQMMLDRLQKHPRLLKVPSTTIETFFTWSCAHAFDRILNRAEVVDPHLASFSSDFKAQFLAMKKDLKFFVAHIPVQNDYGSVWLAIETVHKHFLDMEAMYRKDHAIKVTRAS